MNEYMMIYVSSDRGKLPIQNIKKGDKILKIVQNKDRREKNNIR